MALNWVRSVPLFHLLFEALQFDSFAHCYQYIAHFHAQICRRVKLHHSRRPLNRKDNDAIVLREMRFVQALSRERTLRGNLQLLDLEIEFAGSPERRSNIQKTRDMGPQHGLSQAMSDKRIRSENDRRSG